MTGPAAPPLPLPPELDALIRRMRLPYLRKAAPDVLASARAQQWEPAEVLRVLLAEEVTGRDAATRRMRRKIAGFPSGKTFSSWRPEESSISAATQDALATLEWIGRAENLVIVGPERGSRTWSRPWPAPRSRKTCGSPGSPWRPHRHDRPGQSRRVRRPDRGVLPHHRRRLRAPLRRGDQQHPPRMDSTRSCPRPWPPPPWTTPRPPRPYQRRLAPARRGPRRQGGDPAGHLPSPPGEHAATSLENCWPPARRNQTTHPDFLMAVDSW